MKKTYELNLLVNDEDVEGNIEQYNKLPESVKKLISENINESLYRMVSITQNCQSPIEQLLGIELDKQLYEEMPYCTEDFFMTPQETIEVNGKKYRVDFFIVVKYRGNYHGFVVECDGHDYHEKTKEQAMKDKKRDREILSQGNPVIRFTGSEIYANPSACAREVVVLILKTIKK